MSLSRSGGAMRRHGRRPVRSSLTGPALPNPESRVNRFEADARSALDVIQHHLADSLLGVHIGFATAPPGPDFDSSTGTGESAHPLLYSINRRTRTITMYRMPIQRARGLHVNDAEHRTLFIGHCVYLAVCEYLGREPWDLLPGHFDHY